MKKKIGSIVVTEKGNVVLITATQQVGQMEALGVVPVYDFGIVLRGTTNQPCDGIRILYPSSENVRVVAEVETLVRLLEQSGVDVITRPEKPLSSLTQAERLERLERVNAAK